MRATVSLLGFLPKMPASVALMGQIRNVSVSFLLFLLAREKVGLCSLLCALLSENLFCCVDDVFGQDFPKNVACAQCIQIPF